MKKCLFFFALLIVALIIAVYTEADEPQSTGKEVVMEQQLNDHLLQEKSLSTP